MINQDPYSTRECGDCEVCCIVGEVEEEKSNFLKLAHTPCPHQTGKGCAIYGKPERPEVCVSYKCSWLRGYGEEVDRPDHSGVLVSVNKFNGGTWILVIEAAPDALMTTGRNLVLSVAKAVNLPVIVVNYGSKAPNDTGDRTVVKDSLLPRAQKMIGKKLDELAEGFGVYELVSK
jgi:hypothetical protein